MHFNGRLAAATCDEPGKAITAELVGAKHEHEVAIMNGLSVNLRYLETSPFDKQPTRLYNIQLMRTFNTMFLLLPTPAFC